MTYGDGQVVAAGQFGDFAHISETGAHDNGLVAELLVVVEDLFDALNTWIFCCRIVLLVGCLVPVEDATHEWGDQEGSCLSGSNSLGQREQQRKIAVHLVFTLQDVCSLDAFPGRGQFDEDARFVNAN